MFYTGIYSEKTSIKPSIFPFSLLMAVVLSMSLISCDDSPTDSGLENGNDDPDAVVVEMVGHAFNPDDIEVTAGTTVRWVNESSEAHTVTSGSGGQHDGIFDSGSVAPGAEFSYTFDEAGTYDYYCIPHVNAGMVGVVNVVEEN